MSLEQAEAAQFSIHLESFLLSFTRNAHIWRMCLLWIGCEISCTVRGRAKRRKKYIKKIMKKSQEEKSDFESGRLERKKLHKTRNSYSRDVNRELFAILM